MVSLIALLSSGKGTWGHVNSLMSCAKWDKIYLVCNDFAFENFESKGAVKLKFDEKNPIESMNKLAKFFKKEIKDFEVAINLSSGNGLEHMAVLSSVLKSGLGIRLVYCENKELKEFEILDEKHIPQDDYDI